VTTMTASVDVENIKTKIVTALAEARKARHHRNCYCRKFERAYCNATTALWERALERELGEIANYYRQERDTTR